MRALFHSWAIVRPAAIAFLLKVGLLYAAPLTMNTGGTVWNDADGKQINAHGGCIVRAENGFYWYGENRTRDGLGKGVNCYFSIDLVNWSFKNQVLSNDAPDLKNSQFERPKVIYNAKTKKYVLWVHRENLRNYIDAQALVAVCDTPDGNFSLVKMFRPFDNKEEIADHIRPGFMSRDCTLFKDDDGSAWFVSSANENQDLMFYRLSEDYLDTVEHYNVLPGASREAPALFKCNGKYYLLTSACTGWNFNYNTLQEADKITGPYGPQQDLITRMGDSTYNSQVCYVLPITGSKATTLMFMSDRWKVWNLPNSRYLWLPMRFDKGVFQPMAWGDAWQLDIETGLATFPIDPTPSTENIARGKPVVCDKHNEKNGKEPERIVDGNTKTGWAAEGGDAPQWIIIDLGKSYDLKQSKITWEGDKRAYQYAIEISRDGVNWTKAVDHRTNENISGENDDPLNCICRYAKLTITGKGAGMWFWATCAEWQLSDGSENVALNKDVSVSSAQWGRYAAKITDGDFGTFWTTGDGKPGHWAKIDLEKICKLSACRIVWQNPGYYYRYKIEVSDDGESWSTAIDMSENTTAQRIATHRLNVRGRYAKLTLTDADDGCWPSLAELEIFTDGKQPPAQEYSEFQASY